MRLCLTATTLALVLAFTPAASALECDGIPLDGGCLFTITGGDTTYPYDGYAVTNADDVPLWDFVKLRDLGALGYPISQRWVDGPFTLQAFQKVILQWDSGRRRMNYYNTLDNLANRFPEIELPFVPAHQVLEADRGADFQTITQNHLALLDQNEAIKDRFLAEPDWLNLYACPSATRSVKSTVTRRAFRCCAPSGRCSSSGMCRRRARRSGASSCKTCPTN